MKDAEKIRALAERVLDAWNSQEVERVLAMYTEDLVYRDPNTRGEVRGREAMRRYLTKLFAAWRMRWSCREAFPFEGSDGLAILWHASFRRHDDDAVVEIDGMDYVVLEGDRLRQNEVYFDRAVLAPLMTPPRRAAEHAS